MPRRDDEGCPEGARWKRLRLWLWLCPWPRLWLWPRLLLWLRLWLWRRPRLWEGSSLQGRAAGWQAHPQPLRTSNPVEERVPGLQLPHVSNYATVRRKVVQGPPEVGHRRGTHLVDLGTRQGRPRATSILVQPPQEGPAMVHGRHRR